MSQERRDERRGVEGRKGRGGRKENVEDHEKEVTENEEVEVTIQEEERYHRAKYTDKELKSIKRTRRTTLNYCFPVIA